VNKMAGCTESSSLYIIKKHEAQCPYRYLDCPYHKVSKEECDWSGPLVDMKTRVKEMHHDSNFELTGPLRGSLENIPERGKNPTCRVYLK
jgi:hypothetical protein